MQFDSITGFGTRGEYLLKDRCVRSLRLYARKCILVLWTWERWVIDEGWQCHFKIKRSEVIITNCHKAQISSLLWQLASCRLGISSFTSYFVGSFGLPYVLLVICWMWSTKFPNHKALFIVRCLLSLVWVNQPCGYVKSLSVWLGTI